MDLKRKFQRDYDECDDDQILVAAQYSKRGREDNNNSQQPHTYCVIRNLPMLGITIDMIVKAVTDLVGRIVHEELERRLPLIPRPTINESGPSEATTKFYELVFENELPDTVYTLSKIKAKKDDDDEEKDRPVKIALYDIRSKSIVTSGPLSSLRVEICVVNDDEIFSNEEFWTTEQFKAKILRQMDNNRGKLLRGDVVIQLENGVCYINDTVKFTDNSSRTRTRHLLLGAIVHSTSRQAEVKEAVSNRFMVKDIRVEANQKRSTPFQNDPIWRLKNISKNGKVNAWLSNELKINTVKDLLYVHETNPASLLQKKNYVPKIKEAIKHAKTCIPEVTNNNLDDKRLETVKQHQHHVDNRNAEEIPVLVNPPAARSSRSHSHRYPTMALQVAVGQCSAHPHHHLPTTARQGVDHEVEKGQDFSPASTSTSQFVDALFAAQINNNDQFGAELSFGMTMTELGNIISPSLLEPHDENDSFP